MFEQPAMPTQQTSRSAHADFIDAPPSLALRARECLHQIRYHAVGRPLRHDVRIGFGPLHKISNRLSAAWARGDRTEHRMDALRSRFLVQYAEHANREAVAEV